MSYDAQKRCVLSFALKVNLLRKCVKKIGASVSKGVAAISFGPNFGDMQRP